LRRESRAGTLGAVEEEEGIYRDEVTLMLGLLGDIKVAVLRILGYIEGEDDGEEEEEDLPDT
jgi:hypothetical protein